MEGTEQVARAKSFWIQVDVDQTFDELCEYLVILRNAIKTCTATDREYVQGMNMITLLDSGLIGTPAPPVNDSFVEVVIGADILPVADPEADSPQTPLPPQPSSPLCFDGSVDPLSPSYVNREDLMPPLITIQLPYQPHDCSQACVTNLPKSAHHFRWDNRLRVPLLCSFQRLCSVPLGPEARQDSEGEFSDYSEEGVGSEHAGQDVVYKAPCGRSLHSPGEVLQFLLLTGSHGILQVDDFTFNPLVRLEFLQQQQRQLGPADRDLSRGAEPMPVELCVGEEGARPKEFRYRKERWPHGCFLSAGQLFSTCCDCMDGCTDKDTCACVRLTPRDQHYSYQRLSEPVSAGLYECGPWCGCDRGMCQNRVVQRGLRVRLQVFQTGDKGWGVRCRDDLDCGTFVCTYAGMVLRRGSDSDHSNQPSPHKRPRVELPSDDEVEVVTEWLAPAEERRTRSEPLEPSPPTSPPLHVPVIQRPTDPLQSVVDPTLEGKVQAVIVGSQQPGHILTGVVSEEEREQEKVVQETELNSEPVVKEVDMKDIHDMKEVAMGTSPKRAKKHKNPMEHLYYLEATKEGNVGRFINHSCDPNLFVQNVFTDSHDPNFPIIAFFTSQVVKAGTELTWHYSHNPGSAPEQEVSCQCGSDGCQGLLI